MLKNSLRRNLLAAGVLGLLMAGGASASVRFSDAIDGNWFDPNEGGRGVDFDYIPLAEGGALFLTVFTYDQDGNGIWLTGNANVPEFAYTVSMPVVRVEGGRFDDSHDPAALTQVPVGTVEVELFSCNSATVSFSGGDGLPATEYTLQPLQSTPRTECVWQSEFDGCPTGTTAAGDRTCRLNGNYFGQNLRLTNDTIWVLGDLVLIGDDNATPSTVTIEAGTRIVGGGENPEQSAIYVNRGSKIFAEGKPYAPIVFTSQNDGVGGDTPPAPGDWAGVIVSGNAPTNCAGAQCDSEFSGLYGRQLPFGGDNPTDSSGALRYVQVRYAGVEFVQGREVNSFTMQGVGSGTVLEHLQSYRGKDDAIEFFGGTANLKYFVDVDGGDDSLDYDLGYSGKVQFFLVQQGAGLGENNGIEGASNPSAFDAEPRANPIISNLSFFGNPAGTNASSDAFQFKEGSAGQLWNSYAEGFVRSCVAVVGPQAAQQATGGNLVVRNTRIDCANGTFTNAEGFDVAAFFNGGTGNSTGDAGLVNGFLPGAGSPLIGAGAVVDDGFFSGVDYIGAFRDQNDDWTYGWTHRVRRN